jgi:hypothetical protein
VRVIDKKDDKVHALILQAIISATESQDIAVIELEKTGENNAILQIVGDEDIYGEETIIEPADETESLGYLNNGSRIAHGPEEVTDQTYGVLVNVWFWPAVRFVYAPSYIVWASPWGWRNRPVWWRPWRPVHYHVFHPRHFHYHRHYTVVHTHRIVGARTMYRPHRVSSITVRTKHQASIGRYRVTRTTQRQAVATSNGNKKVQATHKKTTIQGPAGKKRTKTTTHVKRKR